MKRTNSGDEVNIHKRICRTFVRRKRCMESVERRMKHLRIDRDPVVLFQTFVSAWEKECSRHHGIYRVSSSMFYELYQSYSNAHISEDVFNELCLKYKRIVSDTPRTPPLTPPEPVDEVINSFNSWIINLDDDAK